MSATPIPMTMWQADDGAIRCVALAPQDADAAGLRRVPVAYIGHWVHPAAGPFDWTEQDCLDAIAAFDRGVPTSLGIPIDEDANHKPLPDGSRGWGKRLEIGEDEFGRGLFSLVQLGSKGQSVIDDGSLPYFSFSICKSKTPHPGYGSTTYIESCAQVSRPFFYQQPGYRMSMESESDAARGGPIIMQRDEARTQYEAIFGPQSDEAWGAIAAAAEAAAEGEMDWEAWLGGLEPPAAPAVTDPPPSPPVAPVVEGAVAVPAAMPASEGALTLAMFESRMSEMEQRHATEIAERDQRITGLMEVSQQREADALLGRASELVRLSMPAGYAIAPASEPVMVRLAMNPSAETVQEFFDHLKANDGKVQMYPMGMAPQVEAAHVTDPLDALTSGTRAKVERIMEADGLDAVAALHKYNTRPVGGLS
jgi:hypothetical protein